MNNIQNAVTDKQDKRGEHAKNVATQQAIKLQKNEKEENCAAKRNNTAKEYRAE
jgi:hypothetical protein